MRFAWTVRHEFGDRLAVFRDDDSNAGARDLIHQGEALGFELGSFDVAGHVDMTMVRTATYIIHQRV